MNENIFLLTRRDLVKLIIDVRFYRFYRIYSLPLDHISHMLFYQSKMHNISCQNINIFNTK